VEGEFVSLGPEGILKAQEAGARAIRGQGTFTNAIALGAFLLLPFCICLDELLRFKKLRYLPLLALIILGIVSTFSRGAYILAILGMMILVGFYLPRSRLWSLMLLVVLGIAIVVFIPKKYDFIIMKMFGDHSESGLSSNIRYYFWQIAINLFWISPITGLGYGNIGFRGNVGIVGFDPHSSYLGILVNQGSIGLCLFLICLFATYLGFKRVLRYDKYTLRPIFVVFLLYLISLMVDGLILVEPFIYFMPTVFLTIYTSGRGPKSFEYRPHFSTRRYPLAVQSSLITGNQPYPISGLLPLEKRSNAVKYLKDINK
jgi:O-antigen ligase